MSIHKEIHLEDEICADLTATGWLYDAEDAGRYDRTQALLVDDVSAWIKASQSKAWEAIEKSHGAAAAKVVAERLRKALDSQGTLAVLRQGAGTHTVHRQQAGLPLALEVQPLLWAVAQVAFVVHPAPGHALAQTQFFQQVLHMRRARAGHGQVVRTQRAGQATQQARTGVSTGIVLQLQQGKVVLALQAHGTRGGQPGHAATGNERVHAAGDGGLGRGARFAGWAPSGVTKGVAAFPVLTHKTALCHWRLCAGAATRQCQGGAG